MLIGGVSYRPFLLGSALTARPLLERSPLDDLLFVDVLDPQTLPFFHLLNAGNERSFGGIAMPAWVQLDCCTLPSAMIGFAAERGAVDEAIIEDLVKRIEGRFGDAAGAAARGWRGPFPVAEYCALPTAEPGTVVGFSLFSVVAGSRLGARAKALSLLCMGARRQIGMTQYGSSAIRTHVAFGALEIVSARAAAHSRSSDTFVYSVAFEPARLEEILRTGGDRIAARAEDVIDVNIGSDTAEEVARLIGKHGRLFIVAPGLIGEGASLRLLVRAG